MNFCLCHSTKTLFGVSCLGPRQVEEWELQTELGFVGITGAAPTLLTPASKLWESDHVSAQLVSVGEKKDRRKKRKGKKKAEEGVQQFLVGLRPTRCWGRAGRGCTSGLHYVPALCEDISWHLPALCIQHCTSGSACLLLSSSSFRRKKKNLSQEEMSGSGCMDVV